MQAELGGDGDVADAQCKLATQRTRRFLTALAAAAAVELCGAAMAATAPVLAPGVLLLCVAQTPLRMCDWQPDEDGVVVPIPAEGRSTQVLADAALVMAAAVLSVRAGGPAAVLAACVFACATLWHIVHVRRTASLSEAALLEQQLRAAAPTAVRLQ